MGNRCSSWHTLWHSCCCTTTVESRNPSRESGQAVSTFTLVQGLGLLAFGTTVSVCIGVVGVFINNRVTRKEAREQEEQQRLKRWR